MGRGRLPAWVVPWLLGAVALAARLATAAGQPTEWDSVQLVLGVDGFDVRVETPHAPGYWLYVAALAQARQAAGGRDMLLGGGASAVQQYLATGLVDEFELHVVPVLLGAGARLLEHVGDLHVEQVRAIEAPGVTHIRFRVVR